jgi:hypothetical protein
MKKFVSVLTMSALGVLAMASQAAAAPPQPITQNLPAQVSAVPEPGTWAMMIVGVAFIGWAMRRAKLIRA